MTDDLPSNTRRLFPHYEATEKLPADSPGFVIARVLEEGDRADLQWLTRTYDELRLIGWLEQHGDRLLTTRSRSFWSWVFELPDPSRPNPGESLWLL